MNKLENKIEELLNEKGRVVLAIDGMCSAGKTSFAAKLADKYDAAVVHCDDFFLVPELRNEERYKEPGGNIHYERMKAEVIDKLKSDRGFSYRRFDCKNMCMGEEIQVPDKKLIIVEGVYSLHPYFGKYYDLALFMRATYKEQIKRIEDRNQDVTVFAEKWLPMEREYFIYMGIEEKADMVLLSEYDYALSYSYE